jgi:hypothetical protein
MKENEKKLHAQILFWEPNNKNALCWAFYYINDNKEIYLIGFQIMCYILVTIVMNLSPKTQAMKVLIIDNTTNDMITLRKHVNSNHCNTFNFFEKVNCPLKEDENQPSKKDQIFLLTPYLFFLLQKNHSRKMMCSKRNFWKTWVF